MRECEKLNKDCQKVNSHDISVAFEDFIDFENFEKIEEDKAKKATKGEESLSPPKEDDSLKKAAREILLLFKQEKKF